MTPLFILIIYTYYANPLCVLYTGDAISQACSAEKGLKDSAFLSLIELLRKNKSMQ